MKNSSVHPAKSRFLKVFEKDKQNIKPQMTSKPSVCETKAIARLLPHGTVASNPHQQLGQHQTVNCSTITKPPQKHFRKYKTIQPRPSKGCFLWAFEYLKTTKLDTPTGGSRTTRQFLDHPWVGQLNFSTKMEGANGKVSQLTKRRHHNLCLGS